MTSKTDNLTDARAADGHGPDRHFGDIAPVYADQSSNAADARARGAADILWQKVERDLEKIDRGDSSDADDG